MKIRLLWILVSVLAVWTAVPAHAGDETPIRMSGTTADSSTPDLECRGFRATDTGSFSGVPLGRAKWSSVECADAIAEPGVLVLRGLFVLKTGAGTIEGIYEGYASLASARGHFYGWATFRITKSTGRYRGARGTGLLTADVDGFTSTVRWEMSGTLTSFRPNR